LAVDRMLSVGFLCVNDWLEKLFSDLCGLYHCGDHSQTFSDTCSLTGANNQPINVEFGNVAFVQFLWFALTSIPYPRGYAKSSYCIYRVLGRF